MIKLLDLLTEMTNINIHINKGDWNAKTKTFSFYASDKKIIQVANHVTLISPSGQKAVFKYISTDKDGSGEDVYGWNFKSLDGKYDLLIIND